MSGHDEPKYLTIELAARRYSLKENTIRSWIQQGLIPRYKINGSRVLIKPEDIENLIVMDSKHGTFIQT